MFLYKTFHKRDNPISCYNNLLAAILEYKVYRNNVARFQCQHNRAGEKTLDWQGTIDTWWNLGRSDRTMACEKVNWNVGEKSWRTLISYEIWRLSVRIKKKIWWRNVKIYELKIHACETRSLTTTGCWSQDSGAHRLIRSDIIYSWWS